MNQRGGKEYEGLSKIGPRLDGGPAFASENALGMSLRDYMAIHASDTDIDNQMVIQKYSHPKLTRRQARYIYADLMLAERSKT